MNVIKEALGPTPYEFFLLGGKRRSNHSNNEVVFATRKDRRIHDSQFLGPPHTKKRPHKGARRGKPVFLDD